MTSQPRMISATSFLAKGRLSLNIGPRLTLCFAFIVLAMMAGSAVLVWQFQIVRGQAERSRGFDQELILVLQAHTNLMSFYEGLDESQRTTYALRRLPADVRTDPTLLPSLEAIQAALPAQLEAITVLATSADWEAVRLRLAIQVRQLESSMSALVKSIDREVGEQRAQAVSTIEQAQRRIFLIVVVTAVITLLFAGFLGLGVTRSITRPLEQLMEGSRAFARGEFHHQIPVNGHDELAQLGNAFNDTGIKLHQLYQDLSTREEALRTTQERLSRARQTATVGELSASIAHEINQPLAAVVAYGHACQAWLSSDPPNLERARLSAERIVRDGESAAEVVRRIRALFKQAAPAKLPVDANQVISEVLFLLKDEIRENKVEVETDLERNPQEILGDRVQLQQVMLNLTLNGIESMDAIGDRPKRLLIRSHRRPDSMLIEIRDHGTGLKDPDKIFDAFFTTKENGMGMGLAICRSIVELHGGRLWAAPNEAAGTTFSFSLPFGERA
jgi:C4-dicarboxylate-specific signal transduction histidine kinase